MFSIEDLPGEVEHFADRLNGVSVLRLISLFDEYFPCLTFPAEAVFLVLIENLSILS